MATDINTLQQLAAAGLGDYIGQSPQTMEDALYNRMAADIERQSGTNARSALENTFARGVGQGGGVGGASTISADAITPIQRARNEALLKARSDAFVASQQAQLSGLAQAAGAAQNAINSGQNAGYQQQALNLQKKNQEQQRGLATQQAVGQGVGGLGAAALSTAGLLYGPEIRKNLSGLFAGGGGDRMPSSLAAMAGPSSPGAPAVTSAIDMPSAFANFAGPAASALSPASYDFGGSFGGLGSMASSNFSLPDLPSVDWGSMWNIPTNLSFDWGY